MAVVVALAVAPAAAEAGVGASATPTFPAAVTVGDTNVPASIELENNNTGEQIDDENVVCELGDAPSLCPGARGIVLVPSCSALGDFVSCGAPDPGVFQLSSTATGAIGTACAGLVFDVVASDAAPGAVRFAPRADRVELPGAGATCRIDFTFAVLKTPSKDYSAELPGVQTIQVAENVQHNRVLTGAGRGTSGQSTTVNRARPAIATQASGDIQVGGQLTDTATVTGLVNPVPGATVDFRLYGPDNTTCAGPPVFESLGVPLAANGTATSAPFTPTAPGVYRWVATYNGDANNEPVSGACNDANENVRVTPAPPPPPPVVSLGGPPSVTVNTNNNDGPCIKTRFNLRVAVAAEGLRQVRVTLNGRTIQTSKKASFTVRVRANNLPRGRHTIKVIALGEGGRTVRRATFFRCGRTQIPRFVG